MKVFALFQTDPWKTKKSRVFLGVFSSIEAAVQEAKENDVFYLGDAEIDIVECELDKFEEV